MKGKHIQPSVITYVGICGLELRQLFGVINMACMGAIDRWTRLMAGGTFGAGSHLLGLSSEMIQVRLILVTFDDDLYLNDQGRISHKMIENLLKEAYLKLKETPSTRIFLQCLFVSISILFL